jgi:hypothetical protein
MPRPTSIAPSVVSDEGGAAQQHQHADSRKHHERDGDVRAEKTVQQKAAQHAPGDQRRPDARKHRHRLVLRNAAVGQQRHEVHDGAVGDDWDAQEHHSELPEVRAAHCLARFEPTQVKTAHLGLRHVRRAGHVTDEQPHREKRNGEHGHADRNVRAPAFRPSPARVVTTQTPVAKRPSALRRSRLSMEGVLILLTRARCSRRHQ